MTDNVYLFVPNLIGYARIVLAIASFYYMPFDYVTASLCYIISGALDALDGHAARYLNQCSKFGGMLDQLTDRAATMCLLVQLSCFYPSYMFWFQMSMAIDIVSHWMHLQVSTMQGSDSHKKIDLSGNPVLRVYYTNRKVLFFMCAGNELFYAMMYLMYFTNGPVIPVLSVGLWKLICILCAPVAFVKTAISVIHLIAASRNLVGIVPVLSVGLWKLICILCAPVAFVKTAISVIHLIAASRNLVGIDEADIAKMKAK